MDSDVVVRIGQLVVAHSLLTRAEAAVQLAAEQRARAVQGEAILLGTVVRFAEDGEAEYVGGEEDAEQDWYTFRFGLGATARTERMHLALLEPEQWSVSVCEVVDGQDIAEGTPPSS